MSYNTFCYCWQIARSDGLVLRYTTHSSDLDFLGNTWKTIPSIQPTVIQKSLGLSVNNLDFSGVFGESLDITLDDVREGKYEGGVVTGYRVNHQDITDYRLEFEGILGEFTWNDYAFQSEVRSKTFYLNRGRNEVYGRACPFALGDSNCGVNLALHQISTQIVSVTGNSLVVGVSLPSDYNLGRIRYSNGKEQVILAVSGTTITLWEAVLGSPSETISIVRGCDKTRQTCKSRFNNIVRYGGFDLIPPEDILTDVAAPGKPGQFDGSSYYNRLA